MKSRIAGLIIAFIAVNGASATDLTIHLPGTTTVSRKIVKYQCDSTGSKIGLPGDVFSVEYINAGGNSLVIVPVSGKPMIFANVVAGSGARYVAAEFTWWEAGGRVTFISDSLSGKAQTTCDVVRAQ